MRGKDTPLLDEPPDGTLALHAASSEWHDGEHEDEIERNDREWSAVVEGAL